MGTEVAKAFAEFAVRTKLEDIRIKVNYVYSDVFPAGQCQ